MLANVSAFSASPCAAPSAPTASVVETTTRSWRESSSAYESARFCTFARYATSLSRSCSTDSHVPTASTPMMKRKAASVRLSRSQPGRQRPRPLRGRERLGAASGEAAAGAAAAGAS